MELGDFIESINSYSPKREVTLTLNGKQLVIHSIYKINEPYALVFKLEEGKTDPEGVHPEFTMDKSSKKSQTQAIREYLLQGHTLTPLEALEKFGCFRLGARIADLKKEGLKIHSDNRIDDRTGKRYATYSIEEILL